MQRIVAYLRARFHNDAHLAVLHDLPAAPGNDKPPMIDSFRPDVFALDAPLTRVVIGEAKTALDLETAHSLGQFSSYLKYLCRQPQPLLVVAVPWQVKARARAVVQPLAALQDSGAAIELVVIDEVEVLR